MQIKILLENKESFLWRSRKSSFYGRQSRCRVVAWYTPAANWVEAKTEKGYNNAKLTAQNAMPGTTNIRQNSEGIPSRTFCRTNGIRKRKDNSRGANNGICAVLAEYAALNITLFAAHILREHSMCGECWRIDALLIFGFGAIFINNSLFRRH